MKASPRFKRAVEAEVKRLIEQDFSRRKWSQPPPGPGAQDLIGMASELEQEIKSVRNSLSNLTGINGVLNRVGTQQTKIIADTIMRDAIQPLRRIASDLANSAKQLKKEGIRRK